MRPTGRPAVNQGGRNIPELILKEMMDQSRYQKRSLEAILDFGRTAAAIASGMPRQSSAPDLTSASTARTPTPTTGQTAPAMLPAFQQAVQPILQHLASIDRTVSQMMQAGPQASRTPASTPTQLQRTVVMPVIARPEAATAPVQAPAATPSTSQSSGESPALRSLADTVRTWFTAWQSSITRATGTAAGGQSQGMASAALPMALPMRGDEPDAIPGVPGSASLFDGTQEPSPVPSLTQAAMPTGQAQMPPTQVWDRAQAVTATSMPQPMPAGGSFNAEFGGLPGFSDFMASLDAQDAQSRAARSTLAPVPSMAQAAMPATLTQPPGAMTPPTAGAVPSQLSPSGPPVASLGQLLVPVLQEISKNVATINQNVSAILRRAARVTGVPAPGAGSDQPSGRGKDDGGIFGMLKGAFNGAIGQISAVTASLVGLTYTVGKFVGALNPSQMLVLNRAFYDLQAAIGVGLTPIISGVTEVVRQFGSIILPMMQSMKPVVSGITDSVLKAIGPILTTANMLVQAFRPFYDVIGKVIAALAPMAATFVQIATLPMLAVANALGALSGVISVLLTPLQAMSALFEGLSAWLTAASAIGQAFAKTVGAWVSSLMKAVGFDTTSIFANLKTGFETLARYAILAAANLAKFMGMDSFITNLQDALGGNKKSAEGLGAAQNASIGDISSFGRRVMESALLATETGDPKQTEEDWRVETLAELKKLQAGQETSLAGLQAAMVASIEAATEAVIAALWRKVFGDSEELAKRAASGAFSGLSLGGAMPSGRPVATTTDPG